MARRDDRSGKTTHYRKRKQNKKRASIDFSLFTIVVFLVAFGLIMVYSAAAFQANPLRTLLKQVVASGLGFVVMIALAAIDYHFVAKFVKYIFPLSLVTVLLVKTSLGITKNGATRWLDLKITSFQPAEFVKLAVILTTAVAIVFVGNNISTIKGFAFCMVWGAGSAILVAIVTNNMSSGFIIGLIASVMVFVASKNYIVYGGLASAAVVGVGGYVYYIDKISTATGFRQERVRAWLHPEAHVDDKSYQTLQALYSIGSGGFSGKGLGQSMQKVSRIPEAQNDMIFSIVCEELGLMGAVAILALFGLLCWRCYENACNAKDKLGLLIATGVFAHFAIQVILNIAVVTNVIPNTGISLPFISDGGTSILFLLAEIGLVLNISSQSSVE